MPPTRGHSQAFHRSNTMKVAINGHKLTTLISDLIKSESA